MPLLKQYTQLLFLSLVALTTHLTVTAQPINAIVVGNLVIQPDAPKNTSYTDLITPHIKPSTTDFTITLPTLFEQKRQWFNLLHTALPQSNNTPEVFDIEGIEKLNLVGEPASGINLCLLKVIPTRTVFGNAYAAHRLACPATSVPAIKKIQDALRSFAQNPAMLAQAQQALTCIHDNEALFFSFFQEQDTVTQEIFEQLYFGKSFLKGLNNSTIALGALRTWQNINNSPALFPIRILQTAAYIKAAGMISTQAMNFIAWRMIKSRTISDDPVVDKEYKETAWNGYRKQQSEFRGIAAELVNIYAKSDKETPLKKTLESVNNKAPWLANTTLLVGIGCIRELFGHLTTDRKTITQTHESVLMHMRTKLTALAAIVNSLQALNTIINASPALSSMPDCAAITELFATKDASLKQLITLLQTGTFIGNNKLIIVDSARILTAYNLMKKHKASFTAALNTAGAVDAFVAATQLVLQDQQTRYCFVTLTAQATPTLQLNNFWNPLMQTTKIVKNSVALGAPTQTLVITGPNGSGKSVVIKGMVLNIVLAQAFGIAAAESAQLTPFDTMNVYLNVQENLQQGVSTFMAEKQKLGEICEKAQVLPAHQKSLTIIDEPLKGTVEQSGGTLVHSALQKLTRPNTMVLLATHFKKPTELADTAHTAYGNYHIELQEPTLGTFVRTFKLAQGDNVWWFNDAQKRDRFIAWLSTQQ